MLENIDHINIVVEDLLKMKHFYSKVLGLKITKEVTISGAWVDSIVGLNNVVADVVYLDPEKGPRVELIKYQTPASIKVNGLGDSHTPGLRHMAFRVEDIDYIITKLKCENINFLSEVKQVPDAQVIYAGGVRKRLVYFRDPEGNLLELCEYK